MPRRCESDGSRMQLLISAVSTPAGRRWEWKYVIRICSAPSHGEHGVLEATADVTERVGERCLADACGSGNSGETIPEIMATGSALPQRGWGRPQDATTSRRTSPLPSRGRARWRAWVLRAHRNKLGEQRLVTGDLGGFTQRSRRISGTSLRARPATMRCNRDASTHRRAGGSPGVVSSAAVRARVARANLRSPMGARVGQSALHTIWLAVKGARRYAIELLGTRKVR